jgi:uncharacterized membrane protein (DUF485 family)
MNAPDWNKIAADPGFHELQRAKRRFLVPATLFFLIYFLTLPVLCGYCPSLMKTPVIGVVNVAYLFALSQFVMTWTLCGMYVRAARKWDVMSAALLARLGH